MWVEPVYASEIEPYPIAVTKSRFPKMKHLGNVANIKGDQIEPVDIITFGSPCQDMSVAGKRAGLKHTAAGRRRNYPKWNVHGSDKNYKRNEE